MNPVLNTGVLIGVLCGLWTFVMGWTGWYKDPARVNIFFLVILIEVAGLIWGLRRTAREGRGYGAQIVAGTMMAIIAGVVIIGASLLFTTVFFPDYFQELANAYAGTLRQQGRSEAEITEAVSRMLEGATPMSNALQGFLGTLVTGILASAVIAIRVRARPARTAA